MSALDWLMLPLQVMVFALAAPVLAGWVDVLHARLQNRRGPPLLQPWRNLRRLFTKQPVIPHTASWLFRLAPYVMLGAMLLAASALPMLTVQTPLAGATDILVLTGFLAMARVALMIGALDPGTAFGGLGAARELMLSALAEPTLLLALFSLAMTTHSTNLSVMVSQLLDAGLMLRPSFLFTLLALLMVAGVENGRLPADNPTTHLELTMVHEAMVLEWSGRHLALVEWSGHMKLLFYAILLSDLFFPWGLAGAAHPAMLALALLGMLGKLAVLGIVLALAEALLPKMRLFRAPGMLNLAFLLAVLGLLSHVILEHSA